MIGQAPQKFWYRVELNYEGTVTACAQVCGREFGSRHVYFVAASSPEEAQQKVWTKWQEWRAKRLVRLENGGMCTSCGKRARVEGHVKCQHCLDLAKANKKDLRQIRKDPDAAALLELRAQSIADERRDSLDKATLAARGVRVSKADARWDRGDIEPSERSALRRVLRIYDLDPPGFRAWLLGMLAKTEIRAAE